MDFQKKSKLNFLIFSNQTHLTRTKKHDIYKLIQHHNLTMTEFISKLSKQKIWNFWKKHHKILLNIECPISMEIPQKPIFYIVISKNQVARFDANQLAHFCVENDKFINPHNNNELTYKNIENLDIITNRKYNLIRLYQMNQTKRLTMREQQFRRLAEIESIADCCAESIHCLIEHSFKNEYINIVYLISEKQCKHQLKKYWSEFKKFFSVEAQEWKRISLSNLLNVYTTNHKIDQNKFLKFKRKICTIVNK